MDAPRSAAATFSPVSAAGPAAATVAPVQLAEVLRSGVVESRHWGHISVVDAEGVPVAASGTPEVPAFVRSSAKPVQALPLVVTGALDHFGLTDEELAVICGSHNGEEAQLRVVRSILAKVGLDPDALACGANEPYDPEARRKLRDAGRRPTALHNTCSGKHAGMLALARFLGAPTGGYLEPEHPVQRRITEAVATLAGLEAERLGLGTDGCGVPTYAMPLRAMALLFARLAAPPASLPAPWREACGRIVRAMSEHPTMVEGTAPGECLDTELMRALPGVLVAKSGAEGLFAAALRPGPAWPKGLGLAVKIEDGDGASRARAPVVLELLVQLGVLDPERASGLRERCAPPLRNHREEPVGSVRAAFRLQVGGAA